MDWAPLAISLKTSLIATALAFILGICAARLIVSLNGWLRAFLDGIFTLPLVLPPTVLGFFLLLIFGKNSLLGRFLIDIGLKIIFSWEATVIAATTVAFPLLYRTVRASFEQIDSSVINAARTLGLSEMSIFLRILLPLSVPGIAAGTILGFARALGEFGATLMIAGNIPGKTQTIPLSIYFSAEAGRMDTALIWVLIIVSISFLVVLPLNIFTGRKK